MKLQHILLAVFISLIWGVNFVAAKAAVLHFPPFFLLALRLGVAAMVLAPFMKRPHVGWLRIVYISFTWAVLHFGFMFLGLAQDLDVSVAVVVDQMKVPFAAVFGYFILKEPFGWRRSSGVLLAMMGVYFIMGTPNVVNNSLGFWCILASAFAWSAYNLQAKDIGELGLVSFIGWLSLFSVPMLFTLSLVFERGQWHSLVTADAVAVSSLLYMALVATILAHGGWYYLLRLYPMNFVVPYTLLIPVFGILAGIIFMQEALTWRVLVGAAFTILGVGIIILRSQRIAEREASYD